MLRVGAAAIDFVSMYPGADSDRVTNALSSGIVLYDKLSNVGSSGGGITVIQSPGDGSSSSGGSSSGSGSGGSSRGGGFGQK